MKLRDLPVFFLDMQTTGAHPRSAEVLEWAWAGASKAITNHLIQPAGGRVPSRIQQLTGIRDSEMEHACSRAAVIEEFKNWFKSQDARHAVIHFARFEQPFLQDLLADGEVAFKMLCTHEIARRLYPNLPTRSIRGLGGFFGYPAKELKRATSHVEATIAIWAGLVPDLEKAGIETLEQLEAWLAEKPEKKKKGYEYPLPKEIRLSLSDSPGVYRMLSRTGQILYVGKATSLHSRVNSYFRGQKNRDPKKLEMLTQVWDLRVTECRSPLESAILETDEIKRWNPPYNINLKAGARELVFFSRDFSDWDFKQDEAHSIGPFSSPLALDSVVRLANSVAQGEFDENMFYEPIEADLLRAGFELFCERHGLAMEKFTSVRGILAYGLHLLRTNPDAGLAEEEAAEDEWDEIEEGGDAEEKIAMLTPEDLCAKYERHFVRSARAYLRTKALTRLLDSDVEYPHFMGAATEEVLFYKLTFRSGRPVEEGQTAPEKNLGEKYRWREMNVQDYDRMAVLQSELTRLRNRLKKFNEGKK